MTFPYVPVGSSWGAKDGTTFLRLTPATRDLTLPPVVVLHGTAASNTATQTLAPVLLGPSSPFAVDRHAHRALLATGRTLYFPWMGNNWGTATPGVPAIGGTGTAAIDAMRAQAAADGITATTVDLWGTSGGGLSAMNWGWRNPTLVHRLFAQSPAVDLDHAWDHDAEAIAAGLGALSAQMMAVYGGVDRASCMALAEPYDPTRNRAALAVLGDRVTVFSARDDPFVPWAVLESMTDECGFARLVASNSAGQPGGGHWTAPTKPGWDDLLPLEAFT